MLMFSDEAARFDRDRAAGLSDDEDRDQPSATENISISEQQAKQELLQLLDTDDENVIFNCDIKWSLFVTAALSFRRDTCLRPFPPSYNRNDVEMPKDFDTLLQVVGKVPNFSSILEVLRDESEDSIDPDVVKLLHYVLIQVNEPRLEMQSPKQIDEVLKKVPCEGVICRPQYIFKIVNNASAPFETRFSTLASGKNTLFAYHGSKLENFYSILNHGLQQHMNKNMVFGPGIYLSSELSVSLPYSRGSFGWGSSCIGSKLSCVALCELIDTPDGVRCQKTVSASGPVPNKYYVVSNNDLVRVRYLMIYVDDKSSTKPRTELRQQNRGVLAEWICNNKMLTMLIGYCIMLASIGLANNRPLFHYCKLFMKKLETSFREIVFPGSN